MDLAARLSQAVIDHSAGYNCAHSVLRQYAADYNLPLEIADRIASGFGGGMGEGKTCGAITGAVMVLGLACGYTPEDPPQRKDKQKQMVKEFMDAFKALNAETDCYRLLDMDLSIEANRHLMKECGMSQSYCDRFICDAVKILDDILGSSL